MKNKKIKKATNNSQAKCDCCNERSSYDEFETTEEQ